MTHKTRVLVLGGLVACACTTPSDADVGAMGASLAALPKLPYKPRVTPPKKLVCRDKPDLSVRPLTADNLRVQGWLYVCAPVRNVGGQSWSSAANAFTVHYSADRGTTRPRSGGFAALGVGSTKNLCKWIQVPHLLRMGHDTARPGECRATITARADLAFGPDLPLDGNPQNDDCRTGNNRKSTAFEYMASCPW